MDAVLELLGAKQLGVEYMKLAEIKVKDMPRPLNEDYVRQLIELVESGIALPPLRVRKGTNELLDGLHRYETHKRQGTLTVPVEIWDVPEENVYALKVYFNATHGMQLTREQKFESFKKMIESGMDLTNETFAKVLGVSTKTIERWKRRLGIGPKTHKLTEEDKRKIVALCEEGYTQQEIAEMFGVDQSVISRILEQYANRQMSVCISTDTSKPSQTHTEYDENLTDITSGLEGGERGSKVEGSEDFEEEVIDEEEDDDIEELEREIEEDLERESKRVIKVEKRGERLYKVMDEWMTRFSTEHEYQGLIEYMLEEVPLLERQLWAEELRNLIPKLHQFIGILIQGGVKNEA